MEKDINVEEYRNMDDRNEMTPWAQELIKNHAGDIQAKFQEILSL